MASIKALLNPSKTTGEEAGILALIDKIENLKLEFAGIIGFDAP